MSTRYECKLSPEALEKAVCELNEPKDNMARLDAIDRLRKRFQDEVKDMELIRTDDAFLLRFLRVRKFDQDRALAVLTNYHKQRMKYRDIFDLVDNPRVVDDMLSLGTALPLTNRANDGTFVIVGKSGLGYNNSTDFNKMIAVIILAYEKLLEDEEMQIYGVTVVDDMSNFSLQAAMQMATAGKRFVRIIQDGMPIRLKSINVVNEALVFDIIYAFMSPFMKDKMKKRMQLHGSNFKKLHERINPEHLPPFLGGTGPNLDAEAWKREIISTMGVGEETAL